MKIKIFTALATILLVLFCLPVAASAEMLDKDADPPVVASSGSFESTYRTRMEFGFSGGTLTGARWTRTQGYVIYTLNGTCKEGEAVSLSITGTQSPVPDTNAYANLVFNRMDMKLTFRDANQKVIGEAQKYDSGNVKASPLSHQLGASVPAGTKTVAITGSFKCRWATSVVTEETVAVMVELKVAEKPGAALPIAPETGPTPEPAPIPEPTPIPETEPEPEDSQLSPSFVPEQAPMPEPKDEEPWDGGGPWEHAGPLATILISLIAAIAAIFGGAAGAAVTVPAGVAAEPESMVVTTSPHGAQILIVRDPATGGWINSETGNPFDLEAHGKSFPKQVQQYSEYAKHNDELEKSGQTAMQQVHGEMKQEEKARQAAVAQEIRKDRLKWKFGTSDEKKAWEAYEKGRDLDSHLSATWRKAADNIEGAETAARGIMVSSDTLIDGLANAGGPVGRGIRAGYKVTKGVCGTAAEEGISLRSLASGAVKGGTEAASDYAKNPYVKAALNAGGEMVGQGISKGWDGVAQGAIDGAIKAGLDAVPDALSKGYGSDAALTHLKNGRARVSLKLNSGKWTEKTLSHEYASNFMKEKFQREMRHTAMKGVGNLANEFGIKPYITEPLKKKI
jgi:hypothetical protein